jgi:KDO2-lipid IV(A) lauroyltransferase
VRTVAQLKERYEKGVFRMKRYQEILFKTILITFKHVTFPVVCRGGDLVGTLLYRFLRERRKIGLSNLHIAFPEKSAEECEIILKKCWRNISKDLLEVAKYSVIPPDMTKERISIVGIENLNYCFAQNRGVIALSSHYGNFPVICQRLALDGYPLAIIYSRIHNNLINPMVPVMQRKMGTEPIPDNPRHRCVAMSLNWLKKGGVLFLQIDQNPSKGAGVPVDFFGQKLPTFRGPVVMAMRTGASILPMFIIRQKNNHHQIIIEKPFVLNRTGNNEKDIRDNLEALSKIAEDYIRRDPSFWWWIHRRFRMAIPAE